VDAEPIQSVQKGKVVPVHAMKEYNRWKRGKVPHFLNPSTRWNGVVSFDPTNRTPSTHFIGAELASEPVWTY